MPLPRTEPARRRRIVAGLGTTAAVLVLGAVAGCGAGSPPPIPVDGQFPVTVAHRYGETVVPRAPKRVVSRSDSDLDALLALGVVPVATAESGDTGTTSTRPWSARLLRGAGTVHLDPSTAEYSIGDQRPDLIAAAASVLSPGRYEADRRIAPTIAPSMGPDGFPSTWQDGTRLTGQAVGRAATAERLVTEVEARFARARERYPQLTGATAACLEDEPKAVSLLDPESPDNPCSRFVAGLGMRSVAALDREAEESPDFVTPEQLAGPDRPDVVVLDGRAAGSREAARYSLPAGLPVVELDDDEAAAIGDSTVLSLPPALDAVAPKLAAALR